MSNSTANRTIFPYDKGGRNINLPIDGGTHIYKGTMVAQLTATSMLVAGSTAASGHCVGVASHEQDNSSGADGALRCTVETDSIFLFANGSGANACSEATPLGAAVYMFDDHTVYDNSDGDTLQRAGYFAGMEPDGKVRVFVTPFDFGASLDVGEASAFSGHGVRGASTADIADLSAFTVAGVDGLTYAAGERILLKNQTATEENGVYLVGTVAAGVAPLTRALDADGAAEIVPGMLVHVSEGTAAANSWWFLSTNAPITIDTTGLAFVEVPNLSDLAATTNGNGAALIGVEDAAGNFAATTVEAALAEIIADYAATTNGNGASKIGIEDSAGDITATTVEGALAEIGAALFAGNITKLQVAGGTFATGTATINAGIVVTADTDAFVIMSAVVTGSANVGGVAHLKASNVVGGAGVGAVTLNILGADGAVDADAAGAFRVLLVN